MRDSGIKTPSALFGNNHRFKSVVFSNGMKRFVILSAALLGFLCAQEGGARYLIITHDDFYEAVKPLAEWKTALGLKSKIVRLSEIGSDSVSIRNYVVNAYNNWPIRPEYLLLVGSADHIPFPRFTIGSNNYSWSDNYYSDVAGDFHNEIIPGRFWIWDTVQAKTIVTKVLGYEKQPYLTDTMWLKQGMTIVDEDEDPNPADSVYWADTWYAQDLMYNAGYTHVDTFSQYLGHNEYDVMTAWSAGRSYIQYRGVGYRTWDYPFMNIDANQLTNGYMLPVVISATCATTEGIGYEWMYAGTPDQPRGCVGFYGTTTALFNAAEFRSALAKGTFRCIFTDSFATLGKAAETGRLEYYARFGNTLEYNSWTCQGDPAMNLWTSAPKRIVTGHDPIVWYKDTLNIFVTYDSMPVESALVCVRAKVDTSIYYARRTDHNGRVQIIDRVFPPDTAYITVTGRNLYPGFDTIIGGSVGGPNILYEGHQVLDTTGGNGNSIPNNGEDIELDIRVRNFGDSTAWGVSGVLVKAQPDPYCQLYDTLKSFHDMAPAESASTSSDGFNVVIHPDCPDSHLIQFKLVTRDTNHTIWESYFSIRVLSPRPFVSYRSNVLFDSAGGNNNRQVNPAENIDLAVWLANIGDSVAVNVTGTLQKSVSDPRFILSDTVKSFGTILPGDSAWTGPNGYNVYVDSQCPDLHSLRLQLRVKDSLDSTWIYNFTLTNHAPVLNFYDHFIDDSIKYISRADTARLLVWLKNTGTFTAENVFGTLISSDTFLTIIDGRAFFGDIIPEYCNSNDTNQFAIYAKPGAPAGHITGLRLALEAGPYQDTVDFQVYIGKRDYLVWDPDPNHSSGFIIHQKLSQLNFIGDYQQTRPLGYLNVYRTLFITLGVQYQNHILYDTSAIVPQIIHYMNANGKFYLEGGNVWCHDSAVGGHSFNSLFKIQAVNDNSGYCTGIAGFDSTFTRSMAFKYTGETSSLDRINPMNTGSAIFKNRTNNYNYGVAADHRTVGVSFEFSGLVDSIPPSTKLSLADSIMRYFGILPSGSIAETENLVKLSNHDMIEAYPNPFNKQIDIRFTIQDLGTTKPFIKIYDVSGRLVIELNPYPGSGILNNVSWSGIDQNGRRVPAGIYFVTLDPERSFDIIKIVLLK